MNKEDQTLDEEEEKNLYQPTVKINNHIPNPPIQDYKTLNIRSEIEEEKKACKVLLWVLAIIGAIAAVAAIAYAVYRYMTPDYLEDFEDEFEEEDELALEEEPVEDEEEDIFVDEGEI